jgi:hypothetical protein
VTSLLIGCALLALLAGGIFLWGLYYYHKAAYLVSKAQHRSLNREYKLRKERESGVVAGKSSTTDTTKVITKQRKETSK